MGWSGGGRVGQTFRLSDRGKRRGEASKLHFVRQHGGDALKRTPRFV